MTAEKAKKIKELMIKEYAENQINYADFTEYIENKIKNLLTMNNIKYQSISSRVKSIESLSNKLTKERINNSNKNVKNIRDLSGVRIIFYDDEELKKFGRVIYDEFTVDHYKSPEDIFKYEGYNITITLKEKILKFNGMICEVQLTTLLSHAMNEFSHDILYKDVYNLSSKDNEEYEKTVRMFEELKKETLRISSGLEIIQERINSIRNGYEKVEVILNKEYINKIKKIETISELKLLIKDFAEAMPIIEKNNTLCEKIKELKLINLIVKRFSELSPETASFLNINTYEYELDGLFELLKNYRYLWVEDFKYIFDTLYVISTKYNYKKRLERFIEKILISDKIEKSKKSDETVYNYIYKLIIDKEYDDDKKILLAKYYYYLLPMYEIIMPEYNVIMEFENQNGGFKNILLHVINEILNIFNKNETVEILNTLVNMNILVINYEFDLNSNPILDFFYKNYDKLSLFSKNELYKSAYKSEIFKKSNFYKKIKNDSAQMIYAVLFNYFIEEIPRAKTKDIEEFRNKFIKKFIKTFSNNDIKIILEILKEIDTESFDNSNIYIISSFLWRIGTLEKYGNTILKKRWNEYVFLGALSKGKDINISNLRNNQIVKLIKGMNIVNKVDYDLIGAIIDLEISKNNKEIMCELTKLLINNKKTVNKRKYRKYIIDVIKLYNVDKRSLVWKVLHNKDAQDEIIAKYSDASFSVLLDNMRYGEIYGYENFFLKKIFERTPNDLRKMLKYRIINNSENDLQNIYRHSTLADCNNFEEERLFNIELCINVLKDNSLYKISNYIYFLLGDYNEALENDMIKILDNCKEEEIPLIIKLCKLFDDAIECWNIFEAILKRNNNDNQIISEIKSSFYNFGTVYGKNGISQEYNRKLQFFKEKRSENNQVNMFIKEMKKDFENLYNDRKAKDIKEDIKEQKQIELDRN